MSRARCSCCRTELNLAPLAVKLERRRKVNVEGVVQEKAVAAAREARVRTMVYLHACLVVHAGVDFTGHTVVVRVKQVKA